jgi:hypothetical protein
MSEKQWNGRPNLQVQFMFLSDEEVRRIVRTLGRDRAVNLAAFAMMLPERGSYGPESKPLRVTTPYIRIRETKWMGKHYRGINSVTGVRWRKEERKTPKGYPYFLLWNTNPEDVKKVLSDLKPWLRSAKKWKKTIEACNKQPSRM